MIRHRFTMLFLLAFVALPLAAADWPQWRGPHRDGISPETGLLDVWPEGGPRQIWKIQGLGQGYAALAIAQGRIFTQGERGDHQFVVALDAATGKKLLRVMIRPSSPTKIT